MKRITLRQATEQDWPAIQQLHREHQAAQGTNYELPNLFGPAIAIALVGVEIEEWGHPELYLRGDDRGAALCGLRSQSHGVRPPGDRGA